ncbi:TonB-dependent receptor [Marinomonas sp. C2222]|uniref:TonB-dependent receptor n=1 Tax=Marinomonas sargassi TaxID=2984494 RepID=A0ABT2YPQ3_9GAMM|nr:TonB-dependent receptor [Marinomonas sargassi]MCV2401850.1 TonB-dependent receptor [Marinomonas sargassi]
MNQATMNRIPVRLSLIALSILSINSLLISSSAHADAIELQPIIITGEKIDKDIKDTTTAVTVISADDLDSGQIKNAKELATLAPNIVTDSFDNVSVRGVSGGGAATGGVALMTGARARVTTVVDGSTKDWSGYNFSPVSLWDTKQVEILRGPQSTTQGASAIGGAVVVNTNDPTFEREAAVRAGLESYENGNLKYNVAAMSSGGLINDELAYRIAIDKTEGEGWLNYDTSGYSGDLPNLSESDSLNIRGKLLWEPQSTPKLSVKLTLNHLKNEGEHASFSSNTSEGIATQTLTIADSSGALSRVQDSTENTSSIDVSYKLTPSITNSLIISHTDSDIYADGYGYASGTTTHTYDIQQETNSLENRVILTPTHSKLTGVLGLFVSNKESVIDATQGVINIDTDYKVETTAIYGESSYDLSAKTAVIAGLRVENENIDKTGSFYTTTEVDQDIDETYALPKLAITHATSKITTLGASISKGYSPSGTYINTSGDVFSFDSEEVTSFELSSKSDFNNGTTVNANAFYNDYKDYQALSGFTIVNVESATTYGIELEAITWLGEDLEIRAGLGLLKSEINEYASNTSNEGNQLSSAPESNLSLGFTQYIGENWSVSADATYVDEYFSDLANTDSQKAGGFALFNTSAQYSFGDLTINAYIKNVMDEDAVYYRSGATGALATVGQTRTYGINAIYKM